MYVPADIWLVAIPAKPALVELYVYASDAASAMLSALAEAPEAMAKHDASCGPIRASPYYRFDDGITLPARRAATWAVRHSVCARPNTKWLAR